MIYAIGDIHGGLHMLQDVIAWLRPRLTEMDEVVFMGDYIDRGPDSKGVIDELIVFRAEYPRTVFLRGNHEWMMMFCHSAKDGNCHHADFGDVLDIWLSNGGNKALESYEQGLSRNPMWREKIPENHLDFFRETRFEFKAQHYHFVHAGLLPPGSLYEINYSNSDPRLWVREDFIYSNHDFGHVVVFGHTPQLRPPVPLVHNNKIGIDTGGVFGGKLTVIGVDDSVKPEGLPEFVMYQTD